MGEKPAAGAFILFVPVNEPAEPVAPRPRAEVQPDGTFQLSTFGEADGAPAGDYIVTVSWIVEDRDRLEGRYDRSRSKLRATVQAGPNNLEPFRVR